MKIDAGISTNNPEKSGKATKALEEAGYDGAFTAENVTFTNTTIV